MQQLLRFEGSSLEEARKNVVSATGKDVDELEVKRHGRELYGGLFGFFQKTRYVIEVSPYEEKSRISNPLNAYSAPGNAVVDGGHTLQPKNPNLKSLDQMAETTSDSVEVNFDHELQMVLQDANILVKNSNYDKGEYAMAPIADTVDKFNDYGLYRNTEHTFTPAAVLTEENLSPVQKEIAVSLNPLLRETAPLSRDTLYELLRLDSLNDKFGTEVTSLLAKLKTPPPLPIKGSFILGIIGEMELALKSYEIFRASYGENVDLVVMSDRTAAKNSVALRAKSAHELGEIVMEKRLAQQKTVVVFDQKSYLDTLQKSIMVSVPDPLWAAVDSSTDQNQINALDLCVNGIDALMLYDIALADNPLRFLDGKWPVAFVDGWTASRAAVLTKLLEAAERK